MDTKPKIIGVDLASGPDVTAYGYAGMAVHVSEAATVAAEDWSGCRSPSRARRREKQGHVQRVRRYREPAVLRFGDKLVMHPHLWERLKRQVGEYRPTLLPTAQELAGGRFAGPKSFGERLGPAPIMPEGGRLLGWLIGDAT